MRSNPKTVLGLAAVISAVMAIIQTVGVWASYELFPDPATTVTSDPESVELLLETSLMQLVVQLVPTVVATLIQVVASGLFIVLVGAAVLGRKLDTGQTWAMLRPRALGLIALSVLLGLAGLLAVGALVAIVAGLTLVAGGWGLALGLFLALIGALALVYAYVQLTLAPAILVMEARSPWKSMTRSWHLVTGSFWRVLGITLLAAIIVSVLAALVSGLFLTVAAVTTFASEATWPLVLATGVASLLSGIVTLPFSAAVTGLLYTDLRIRREALDVELVAAGVDPTGDPLAPYRRHLS